MNFLQGVQRLRMEAGVAGTGPSSVDGQSGESLRLVEWFRSAYEDIQNIHEDWNFLRESFSIAGTSGDNTYSYTDAAITSFGEWAPDSFRSYLTATGVSDEQDLKDLPWDVFRDFYVFGINRTNTGRPHTITVKPDKTLMLYPIPNAAYTVVGEYYKAPQTLSADADTMVIPVKYQMVVVWRALMFFAANNAEPDKYAHAEREYKKILRKMQTTEMPLIRWGAPIA